MAHAPIAYGVKPGDAGGHRKRRGRGAVVGARSILLADPLSGRTKGRAPPAQIAFRERGNIPGAQLFAVAGKVYEPAKAKGIGRDIPTERLLHNIRN
ncbi:MAG: hypothetical protein ACE5KF_06055 [Kiloniellaceae bacterium]